MLNRNRRKLNEGTVLVVGLGRFGTAVAGQLVRLEQDVLAIDDRADLVERYADEFTHVVQLDATDGQALAQIGVDNIERAVVAIGNDVEASIMTAMALVEAGVGEIWAKAITRKHGVILERIGVHRVVYPERDAGERVAHTVAGDMIDFIEFDDAFTIARTKAPEEAWGRTLAESAIRARHGVTVVGVKRHGSDFQHAVPETVVRRGDELIVSGASDLVEKFCIIR